MQTKQKMDELKSEFLQKIEEINNAVIFEITSRLKCKKKL